MTSPRLIPLDFGGEIKLPANPQSALIITDMDMNGNFLDNKRYIILATKSKVIVEEEDIISSSQRYTNVDEGEDEYDDSIVNLFHSDDIEFI